jgi:hypothetical protein
MRRRVFLHLRTRSAHDDPQATERETVLAARLSCGVELINDSTMVDAAKRWAEQLIETGKPIMLQFQNTAVH